MYRKLTPASEYAHALLASQDIKKGETVVVYGGEYWLDQDLQKHEDHADDDKAREVIAPGMLLSRRGIGALQKENSLSVCMAMLISNSLCQALLAPSNQCAQT